MKLKYLSILLIILILSVGAVSAQDNSTSDSNIDVLQDDEVVLPAQHIVDDSSYNSYFNETTGKILENSNISDGDILKIGNVTGKNFVIDKALLITSNSSDNVLFNSEIILTNGSDNSIVSSLVFNNSASAIQVENALNISILDNQITVEGLENSSDNIYAIYAENAQNLNIIANVISYTGKTNGNGINNAIRITDADSAVIEENKLFISIPSADVSWDQNWVSSPISEGIVVDSSDSVSLKNNTIVLNATDVVGGYDTIYVVDFKSSDNAVITANNITASGHQYIYGIIINGDDFSIEQNNISIESDTYYANGIDIEGPASGNVDNNYISTKSPVSAYPIYSAMSNGDVKVSYTNNKIFGESDIVYGMELGGFNESVINNEITVFGNKTTAIALKSNNSVIENNSIIANGTNLGNTSVWDAFAQNTIAINLYNTSSTISNNIIYSTSTGINVQGGSVIITSNEINVEDTGNIDSYGIKIIESDDLAFTNNNITYNGKSNSLNTTNYAVYILSSNNVLIEENNINITVPAVLMKWEEIPPASGNWVSEPYVGGIYADSTDSLKLNTNTVTFRYGDIISSDSLYAIDIRNSNNTDIIGNNIDITGNNYIYGIEISANDFSIENNTISVVADSYYACAINVEGPSSGIVSENIITVESPAGTYGIYSGMSHGDVNVTYEYNTIYAESYAAYGFELGGTSENVIENTIIINGTKTIGVASYASEILISDNEITVNGDSSSDMYYWDSVTPETAGIKLLSGNAQILNNIISSSGNGINLIGNNTVISNNNITVNDNGNSNSYGIIADASDSLKITDNTLQYTGNTNGTFINNALYVIDSNNTSIENNTFNCEIPSVALSYAADWSSTIYSQGIVIKDSANSTFKNNNVSVNYTEAIGSYDSLYGVEIDADNVIISENNITVSGHSYTYGVVLTGDNININNNNIEVSSDNNYAAGLSIEAEGTVNVESNTVNIESPVVAYAIRSSAYTGSINANYTKNNVTLNSPIAYGIYLAGTQEDATLNNININGNYTIGIASSALNASISNNTVNVNASNVGNSSTTDSISPESVGVKVVSGNAIITGNEITSSGNYTVNVTNTDSTVAYNNLIADELFGDESVYFNGSASVYNNTPEADVILTGEDVVMYYKNGTRYVVTLTTLKGIPLANKTVVISINGRDYSRTTNENGSASIALNLNSGEYNVSATYSPGDNLSDITVNNTVTILATINASDITKVFRNGTQFYATFFDGQGNTLANGTEITFNINGVMYTRYTNENGTARLNINLEQGSYIITSINSKTGELATNNITVLSLIDENYDLVKYYKNASQYVVRVIGEDGNPVGEGVQVTFNINGVFYNRTTNATGHVKLNINLQPGNYTITAYYNNCRVSNNIEVLPVLTAEDLIKKYGTSDQFRARLVDGQGNPYGGQNITFNIHGVFYSRTTDNDGYATLNIRLNAAVDEYVITSSYNGTSIANTIKIVE